MDYNHDRELSEAERYSIKIQLDSTFDAVKETMTKVNEFLEKNITHICINLWCFQEMLVNAVEHGNRFHPNKQVIVQVEVLSKNVIFTITDEGDGFDWKAHVNRKSCLLDSSERGRGIVMSSMLSSHLEYNDKGNQVTIVYDFDHSK